MRPGVLLAMLVLLAVGCSRGDATDYFVDNGCPASGSGVSPTCGADGPFRSIAEAFAAELRPGSTIRVHAGATAYDEPALKTPAAGSRAHPITLAGEGERRPVWTGTAGVRLLVRHRFWVVDGFEIDGGNLQEDLIKVQASQFTLRRSELHRVFGDGLSVGEDADRLTVEDCWFHHLGTEGDRHAIVTGKERGDVRDYWLTGISITGNRFEHLGGDGIQLYEASGACRQATVTGRIAGNVFVMGSRPGHENGIDVKTRALVDDPLVIDGNSFTGWDGSSTETGSKPVVIQHCSDYAHFTNNLVVRGEGSGECDPCLGLVLSASTALERAPVRGVRVVGNTFVGMKRAIQLGQGSVDNGFVDLEVLHNTGYGLTSSMFRIAGPVSGRFHNNLVTGKVLRCTEGGDLSGAVSSHNGWFGNERQQRSCEADCGSLCSPTDTTGSDPRLVDPAGGEFGLADDSPAIDRGLAVGLPFEGAAPDLGAEERRP